MPKNSTKLRSAAARTMRSCTASLCASEYRMMVIMALQRTMPGPPLFVGGIMKVS
jgi:hypothetical protein